MSPKKNSNTKEEEVVELRPDRYVKLMSLLPFVLNLPRGKGIPPLSFKEFGEIKRVTYSVLIEMMNFETFERFLNNGNFTILDDVVTRYLGLEDSINKILKKDDIEKIFDNTCSTENAFEMFKSANDRQKVIITDMLVAMIRDGKDINMNLVQLIERDSKIKIIEKAEMAKEAMELGVP
jgi:hypothetical protein